jgi:outer membrane protein OmpA-like peptidoglycan-associated protein
MRSAVCLGFTIGFFIFGCEPPAKPTAPPTNAPARAIVSAAPAPAPSAGRLAWEATPPAPSAMPVIPSATPCPPEAPQPAGAMAWVNGCKILTREKIYFDIDKDRIRPQSFPVIDAIGDILVQNPDFHIEVQGHLGSSEHQSYGRNLSQLRAKAVMRYLVEKKGIDAARLEAKGYGATVPLADPKTEEGRSLNRRIEIVIYKWRGGTNRVYWPSQ